MYGKINLWWRKSRTKTECKVTRLPELNDLFLKMLKKKASFPMSLNHENTQFKNSNGFAAKIVHDMYWYQRFRNNRKHAKQSILINPERNN